MARRARLSGRRPGLRLLPILAAVLLAHGLLLDWFARHQPEPAELRKMAAPMFTRLLQQQTPTPPAPAAALAATARAASPRPTRLAAHAVATRPSAATPTAQVTPEQEAPQEITREQETPAQETPELETLAQEMSAQPPRTPASETPAPPPEETPAAAADSAARAAPGMQAQAGETAAAAPASPASDAGAAAPSLDNWPRDTRLTYQLGGQFRSGELYGDARVQWQREDSRYQAQIDIDVTLMASLVLTSQGEVTPQGLLPSDFEERKRGKVRSLRFGEETVTLANGRAVPRPQGVQDTASQFVELSHRFASGRERLEVGRAVSLWMARPGAVDLWTYDIVEREMLQTPRLGEVEAFRLKPRPIANPRGNISAEMWFAPSLQYLPVRIRVSMGEATFVDLLVEKIEQR